MGSNFSEKQLRILAFPNSRFDALICDGAVRSGKTSVMSTAFVLWAMRDFNKCNFGICSKTVQTAIKNVVKPLLGMKYLNERFQMNFHRTSSELVITDGKHTNTFYIYGGKDESSYQLIQGITLAGVFLDEVALMPRSFVEQALARCSVTGSRFWFNCNPEGRTHWFFTEWIQRAAEHNALHLHFTMSDNPSLAPEVRARYESMYSGVFYQRYILGNWVSAEGLIYDMFDPDVHVVKQAPPTTGDYYVSCDFGIQNATVFLLWRRAVETDAWVCLREWYYSGREERQQKTVEELNAGLESILPRTEDGTIIEPKNIIVDPSAAALIVELRRHGHHCRGADNEVRDGISDVSTLLQMKKLLFLESCKNTINEFGVYSWDAKAADRGEDIPVKMNDHAMDAVRYFVKTQHLVRRTHHGAY